MRLRFAVLFVLFVATAFVWACSLNPQPLPPDTVDGAAMGSADAKSASDAATLSPDGGFDWDAEPSPGDSGGSDVTEAADDAGDASDAADAREDADDAGSDE
jgi:hypothetical protein